MKKILSIILCFVFVLAFSACGDTNTKSPAVSAHSFASDEVKIEMGVNAADILANLGDPKTVTEEASCAFDGMDKTYYYGNFYLTTYPDGNDEYVYSAWFVDDSLTTEEGIYIGADKSEVENAYGTDCFNGSNAYVIDKGNSKLTVIVEDDTVTGITYDAIVD